MLVSKFREKKERQCNNMATLSPIKVRHQRLRKKIAGTPQRPRLAVHFSGQHIYAQIIDDEAGRTVASANTTEKEFTGDATVRPNIATATKVGKLLADRATPTGLVTHLGPVSSPT